MPLQVKRSDKAMLEVHSSASRGAKYWHRKIRGAWQYQTRLKICKKQDKVRGAQKCHCRYKAVTKRS